LIVTRSPFIPRVFSPPLPPISRFHLVVRFYRFFRPFWGVISPSVFFFLEFPPPPLELSCLLVPYESPSRPSKTPPPAFCALPPPHKLWKMDPPAFVLFSVVNCFFFRWSQPGLVFSFVFFSFRHSFSLCPFWFFPLDRPPLLFFLRVPLWLTLTQHSSLPLRGVWCPPFSKTLFFFDRTQVRYSSSFWVSFRFQWSVFPFLRLF